MNNNDFLHSFKNAINGVRLAFKSERNIKIHFAFVGLVIIALIIFEIKAAELAIVFLTMGLVLVTELINTAIEKFVDLVKPEYHVLAGYIKDVAAGAVLISAIIAVIVGIIVFGPKILNILGK